MGQSSADLYNFFVKLFCFDESDPRWKILRSRKITASIAAVIAGCSTYGMPKHLASSRHGTTPGDEHSVQPFDNDAMKHGVEYEPATLQALELVLDVIVSLCPFRVDQSINWIAATPDGIILHDHSMPDNGPSLVEAKSPFYKMYETPPIMYIFQMMMQMHVYKVWRSYLVARFKDTVSVWRVYYSKRFYSFFLMMAMRYKICVDSGVAPGSDVIPMNPYAAEELVAANFEYREEIAESYGIKPYDLPPYVHIEVVCKNRQVESYVPVLNDDGTDNNVTVYA